MEINSLSNARKLREAMNFCINRRPLPLPQQLRRAIAGVLLQQPGIFLGW
jgi:hypothetical protein